MPQYGDTYPMVLNGVFIGLINIRSDVKNYYNIPDPTAAELAFVNYRGEIAAHTRNIFSNRLDSTAPTKTIQVSKKTGISRSRGKTLKGRGGKPIKIPTELTTTPATAPTTDPGATVIRRPQIRYTTLRFPGEASIGEISAWLHLKLTAKKPATFTSPGGKAYPVAPLATGATVSGQDTTP